MVLHSFHYVLYVVTKDVINHEVTLWTCIRSLRDKTQTMQSDLHLLDRLVVTRILISNHILYLERQYI